MAKLHQIRDRLENNFFGICLDNPKNSYNIGGVIRAAAAFDGSFVAWSGSRFVDKGDWRTLDTEAGHLRMPCFKSVDIASMVPEAASMVAIEICQDACSLFDFVHPAQAVYFFGPEDGSLNAAIVKKCTHKIFIPTIHSLNLSNTVNILAYDRAMKMSQRKVNLPVCPACNHTYYSKINETTVQCNACNNLYNI